MSRIDVLIQQLCPEGVRLLPLGQFINIIRGQRVTKRDLIDQGVPVVSGGVGYMGFVSKSNREANTITMAQYGAAGYVKWQTEPFWANDVCFSLIPKDSQLNYRYLYYFLKDKQELLFGLSNRNAIPYSIDAKKVLDLKIPAPPLEIQKEIVSILDKFTQLEAELEAEVEARRTQYEVTRDRLLDFSGDLSTHPMGEQIRELYPEGVPLRALSELAKIGTGSSDKKDAEAEGLYPFYVRSREVFRSTTFEFDETAILIPGEGGIGEIFHFNKGPYALHQRAYRVVPVVQEIEPKFLYFFMVKSFRSHIVSRAVSATVTSIRKPMIESFHVPVPPLEVQRDIVLILDKLDALVNDISYGIPAEIAARRKQYEYYRNRLLTFKELDAA